MCWVSSTSPGSISCCHLIYASWVSVGWFSSQSLQKNQPVCCAARFISSPNTELNQLSEGWGEWRSRTPWPGGKVRKSLSFAAVAKHKSRSVTTVRWPIPAAGTDPLTLVRDLRCEVTGDSLLLTPSSQIL